MQPILAGQTGCDGLTRVQNLVRLVREAVSTAAAIEGRGTRTGPASAAQSNSPPDTPQPAGDGGLRLGHARAWASD